MRREVTSKLNHRKINKQSIVDTVAPYLNSRRLIISDENLIGGSKRVEHGLIYPALNHRLKSISAVLRPNKIDIIFAVREYSGFIVSMYSEYLRHFTFITFEEYISGLDIPGFSWVEIVNRIQVNFPKSKIYLVDFSKFTKIKNSVVDFIAGCHIELKTFNKHAIKRQSISEDLWEVLYFSRKKLGANIPKLILNRLEVTNSLRSGKKYMPFSRKIQQTYLEKYNNDLIKLHNQYRFIT